jgi:hypothetical protein
MFHPLAHQLIGADRNAADAKLNRQVQGKFASFQSKSHQFLQFILCNNGEAS